MALTTDIGARVKQIGQSAISTLRPNFYRLHLTYFLIVILVFSVILWGGNAHGSDVRYIDALFLVTSAMCGAGLNTIDLGILDGFQQAILFLAMLLGDLTIITQSVVWVRRYFFRKKLKELLQHSPAAEHIREGIEQGNAGAHALRHRTNHTASKPPRRVEPHVHGSDSLAKDNSWMSDFRNHGYGGFPAPWNVNVYRRLAKRWGKKNSSNRPVHHYLSFEPDLDHRGRIQNLTSKQEAELGGVEYRALVLLTWVLPCYTLIWITFIIVILAPYAANSPVADIIHNAQPGNLSPAWWAIFTTVSGYTNTGLTVLNQSFIPLSREYGVLVLAGTAVLAGNAFYPVLLRLAIWTLSKMLPKESHIHHSCSFLLHHPRRCFLFLFPARNTWILFGVQVAITLTSWIFWHILQLDYSPITSQFPPGQRTMDGLFQSVGVRASGFYIITISELVPALQIFYLVVMYISVFPILLSVRSSNVYEERSLGQETSSPQNTSGNNQNHQTHGNGGLSTHVRKQLAYDIWWLLLAIFLVCIIERTSLVAPAPGWTIFSVMFETVSAYGTVGLSLGVPYASYSFSGTWHSLSKLILMTVMIRGRHRILPAAIDRAVLVPGEEVMERLDREFGAGDVDFGSDRWRDEEREVRREESGSRAESGHSGERRRGYKDQSGGKDDEGEVDGSEDHIS